LWSRVRLRLLFAIVATMLFSVGVASASAASSIEGIWSFGGGQIAVHPGSNGTLVGTVVVATTFAECPHRVEEEIWKEMRAQPDGSYWGFHQWYFEGTCVPNPVSGPTAWRVLQGTDGSTYLRVCFSHPGSSQPMIPAVAPEVDVSYGCVNSALTAPLPLPRVGAASFGVVKKCVSARHFTIHLAEPRYDPFKSVRVSLKGHRFKTRRAGSYVVAKISLEGLPPGGFTLKIAATTILGLHLSGSRTYHTCAAKPIRRKPAKLKERGTEKRR
jgi:hypothetical protein